MDFGTAVLARVGRFPRQGSRGGSRQRSAGADRFDSERTAAMVAALGVHVAFALLMMQPPKPFTARDEAAFDVVFIERIPPPAIDSVVSEASDQVVRAPATATTRTGLTVEVVPRTTEARAAPATAPTSSIPETTDDDRWDIPARPGPTPGMEFHDNPLERPMAVAPPAPERFRMRSQRSPGAVVKGVAQLVGLWPPGYTDDPCPQISRNVELLSQAGDAASRRQLHADLEIERRYCR